MTEPKLAHSRLAIRRAGMTVIVVLGIISITLALSYAMLRAQVTSVEIQSNLERRNLARQAAYAGISSALRTMHSSSWGGVDTALQQDLASHQWFEVGFTTGDASLTPSSADYAEYPFRVTIDSTGYAADPAHPDVRSSYRVRAVVELIRKKLYPAPSGWTPIKDYTAYQWSNSTTYFEFPLRCEGPLWLQGPVSFSADYPIDPSSRAQYYDDLLAMKNAGIADYRPVNGPVYTPFVRQTATNRTFMQSWGLSLNDITPGSSAPVSFPSASAFSYQLYPGGKTYPLPIIQSTYGSILMGVTLTPNPVENPLGVYLSNGTLYLGTGTNITGTILTTGSEPDVRIFGKNVTLQSHSLPGVEGATATYQLPVAIVKDDFQLTGNPGCTIRGVVTAFDEFIFERGVSTAACDMQGHIACSKLYLYGRSPWDLSLVSWQTELTSFNLQRLLVNGIKYYPQWLHASRGFDPNPQLTIKADDPNVVHHWHTFGQPVYTYGDGDDGLRWNLLDWTDNPSVAN